MNAEIYEQIIQIIFKHNLTRKNEIFEIIKLSMMYTYNQKINYGTFTSIYSNIKRRQIFKSNSNIWRKFKEK